ncbi:hypothetical protein G7Y89_g15791 [Cudoniella acicularis]|uniref:NACHT domain-containing protein n=1 Tax=Cudoniella acicularis TaxID=354080 RepID=A0A8H4QG91_9HELO|nr:hypothetical protein G7Y89_g15791 [Cudoniella acicularis]
MSGAEFIAVAGVISSIIAIVNGMNQVVEAALDAESLPRVFHRAPHKLPIIRGKVETLMKEMLEGVQLLATFKIMTATKVEEVIKTDMDKGKVAKTIADVAGWEPSVPDHVFDEGRYTVSISGSGHHIVAQGENVKQSNLKDNARQIDITGNYYEGPTNVRSVQNYIFSQSSKKDESQACMRALFLTDPSDDRAKLVDTKGARVDGTCKWITTNPLYKSWLCSHSQLLWLSGGPGKGKTMLSIFLAEQLEHTAKNLPDTLFLQYFCDNKDEKRNSGVVIVRGLIWQLLQKRRQLFVHILPSFEDRDKTQLTTSFETLWRIFEATIRDPILCRVFCVLDGLDECDLASLEKLLQNFATLLLKSIEPPACHLNLVIVSRSYPEFIPKILSSFPRIRLDPDADTDVNNDIRRFIKVKVNDLSEHKQYPEPLSRRVEKVFQDRAQGTFLWVGIVAQELWKYKATEVEKALDLFPSGLEELYARILLQINRDRRETAAKILLWVVMAIRPLTLSELSIAIDIRSSTSFSQDEVMRDQVSYCGYFLTIKEDKVGLIHQSAKDYLLRTIPDLNPELESFRIKEKVGNLEITRKCLDYLHNGALKDGELVQKTFLICHSPSTTRSL